MHFFKLLPAYIRAHMPYFIMGSMITAVFSAMTFLYRLPADGIFYAVILCLCIAVLCMIPSFRRFVHLHKRLSEITGLLWYEAR